MSPLELFSDELELLVERSAPSVVALEHGRGHGSGLLLGADGFLLTNAHVVQRSSQLGVRFHDGRQAKGEVVGRDPPTDLAVVRTELFNDERKLVLEVISNHSVAAAR